MSIEEFSAIDHLSGLERSIIRSKLSEAFKSKKIVNKIEIDIFGRVMIYSVSWDEFWNKGHISGNFSELLDNLKSSRRKYFESGFSSTEVAGYCYSYFYLLSTLLEKSFLYRKDKSLRIILSKLLCFENFAIRWYGIDCKDIAAGTASHRSPLYLLAKLNSNKMLEDPKYLPILALPNNESVSLFYHYRQYKLNSDPNFSLFLYPAVSNEHRAGSFNLIESFIKGFSNNTDPRSHKRAVRMSDSIIFPFLNNIYSTKRSSGKLKIKITDIGGGNGALVSHTWRHIQNKYSSVARQWHLICSVIGLRVQNPIRHFTGSILSNTSYFDYCQSDYRNWLENNFMKEHDIDVILLCRLLNNISNFDILKTDNIRLISQLAGKQKYQEYISGKKYLPVFCLKKDSYNPKQLILTNGKVDLNNASAYRSLSLSDYYKGLYWCKQNGYLLDNSLYYPVRKFNKDALRLSDGSSLIKRLSQVAKLVVVEDTDLNEQIIADHFECFKLDNCTLAEIDKNSRCSSKIFALSENKFLPFFPESLNS